ncbi:hypothetical protein ACF0H5_010288 [Mactra antiquata]
MELCKFVIFVTINALLVNAYPNIIDQLTANGATTLVSLIDQAGLTDTLKTAGPFTVIAPTNAAFQKVPQQDLAGLQSDMEALKDVLLFHVFNGETFSFDLKTGERATALNGHVIRIRSSSGQYYFNEAAVIQEDIQASNGVIFLVDEVLDVPEGTIWQILNNPDYHLSKFASITKFATRDSRLNSTATTTRYTVFAPSDDAFNKLPAADLNTLMNDLNNAKHISDYHTHRGILVAANLQDGTISTMHTGQSIKLSHDQSTGEPRLNGKARVIIQDIQADNGYVHIISDVLIPPTVGGIIG